MEEVKIYKSSEKILIWLHREKLSQVWLAEKLGVTRQAITNKISDNSFTPFDIIRIKAMGCPL
jgi:predicted XRE-type DNA-binding protein